MVHEELAGSRLLLRSAQERDGDILFRDYFSDAQAAVFLRRSTHTDVARTRAVVRDWSGWSAGLALSNRFAWIIEFQAQAMPIGMLFVMLAPGTAEIHFGLSRAYWSRGFATEAVGIAAAWLLSHAEIDTVHTAVDAEHAASRRVLSKSGFQEVGLLRGFFDPRVAGGPRRDAVAYEMRREQQSPLPTSAGG